MESALELSLAFHSKRKVGFTDHINGYLDKYAV